MIPFQIDYVLSALFWLIVSRHFSPVRSEALVWEATWNNEAENSSQLGCFSAHSNSNEVSVSPWFSVIVILFCDLCIFVSACDVMNRWRWATQSLFLVFDKLLLSLIVWEFWHPYIILYVELSLSSFLAWLDFIFHLHFCSFIVHYGNA